MTVETYEERLSFKAEAVQILDLMINSLYSDKEIFLRELISNASDAIDRLRLELITQNQPPDSEEKLQIRVSYNKDAGTITIADNGIGMSRQELIEHIGTIAKSGTREFLQRLTGDQRKDATLIGQFGVGFYSAFIVAERVVLTTRRSGLAAGEAIRWESDGQGEYTLQDIERPDRGTTIVLHLRAGEDDLLDGYRLRSIITRYSDHVSVPIVMAAEPGAESAPGTEAQPPAENIVNQASALWTRPKAEISQQDYDAFYRHVSGDFSAPLAYSHTKLEGLYEYTLLLFVPSQAPFDLWVRDSPHGVKLHVQRVFIMEDAAGYLIPRYLRFLRGVIDSSDLPLNVSRELLQGSRVMDNIRSRAVKTVLKLLQELADHEPDKYAIFWKELGTVFKEGVADDYANRDDIARLLRFASTKSSSDAQNVSFADYASRMREGQNKIYYLLAPTVAAAVSSPHLEAFRQKGIEVLLLTDPVDNWVVSSLQEVDGKRLQSVAQGASDFGDMDDETDRAAKEQAASDYAELLSKIKAVLADKVWDVRITDRLTTSPACIVANEPETDFNLMRRLRGSGRPSQTVLELNPHHPLIERLNRNTEDPRLPEWAHILYSQAVLTLGARLDEPAAFVGRLNDLLITLVGGKIEDSATE
jgi:molecular chaperone HtpG